MTDADGAILGLLVIVIALQILTIRRLRYELGRFRKNYGRGIGKSS